MKRMAPQISDLTEIRGFLNILKAGNYLKNQAEHYQTPLHP